MDVNTQWQFKTQTILRDFRTVQWRKLWSDNAAALKDLTRKKETETNERCRGKYLSHR